MYTDSGEVVYTDMQVGSLRMFLAGIALIPFGIINLRKIKNSKQFISLAAVGFAGNFFPAFLFTYAETGISSGFAGMLNSCTPIFTILLGSIFYNSKFTKIQLAGVVLGTIGIISLMIAGRSISMTGGWIHILAVVAATFLYANSSALFASSVTYIIPIVAVSIGLGFGERIHPGQVLSMLLILSGVFVANYGQKIFSSQKEVNNS